ncbi:MAG: hypothetical protein ABIT96_11640 [Ferruginibacter sp.]
MKMKKMAVIIALVFFTCTVAGAQTTIGATPPIKAKQVTRKTTGNSTTTDKTVKATSPVTGKTKMVKHKHKTRRGKGVLRHKANKTKIKTSK